MTNPGERDIDHPKRVLTNNVPRRDLTVGIASTVVGAVLFGGLIAFIVTQDDTPDVPESVEDAGFAVPTYATDDYALLLGDPNSNVTVSIYEDALCGYCADFNEHNSDAIKAKLVTGEINVEFHPMHFLDDRSDDGLYSTRAANAMIEVSEVDPLLAYEVWDAYYAAGMNLGEQQMVEIAQELGVDETTTDKFSDLRFQEWIQVSQQASYEDGVQSTPTIFVNGYVLDGDWYDPSTLELAINKAPLWDDASGSKGTSEATESGS